MTPRRAQRLEHAEELVGLLRGQHPGGLVEDQDLGVAVQRLQDLGALLLADRQLADDLVEVHGEPVLVGQARQLAPGVGRARGDQRVLLGAEHDVLEHAERLHQHEVLVHHADADVDRVARAPDVDRLTADQHLALVGLVEAVEDAHQRGLAGPVLADDAVDRAAAHGEIDLAVRHDRAEALGDAAELDRVVGDATVRHGRRRGARGDRAHGRFPGVSDAAPGPSRETAAFTSGRSSPIPVRGSRRTARER